jgi:origin recognition complex subunit 2
MKALGESNRQNPHTPTKRKLLSGLTVTQTPTKQVIADDLDRAGNKENTDSPLGKELYSFQRKRTNLQKYTSNTPYAQRSRQRLRAERARRDPVSSSDNSDSDVLEEEETEELQETSHERFFQDKVSKSSTSNNTLEFGHLDPQVYAQGLLSAPKLHENEKQQLIKSYELMFPQFAFELVEGFNLLFYGYGSKKDLLESFVDDQLDCGPSISIFGYFPQVSLKTVLSKTLSNVFDYSSSISSPINQAKKICELLETSQYPYITFVIHNIEGRGLANEISQKAISVLAEHPKIYLVASCDHLNTALLWDHSKLSSLAFAWHDVTNYRPYLVETSFETSVLGKVNQKSGMGMVHVLRSLAQNARSIFLTLARYQLENMEVTSKAEPKDGMSFDALFRKCKEGFHCNNMVTFRTLLTEFKDHECILSAQVSGTDFLYIPLRKVELEDVVTQATEQQ